MKKPKQPVSESIPASDQGTRVTTSGAERFLIEPAPFLKFVGRFSPKEKREMSSAHAALRRVLYRPDDTHPNISVFDLWHSNGETKPFNWTVVWELPSSPTGEIEVTWTAKNTDVLTAASSLPTAGPYPSRSGGLVLRFSKMFDDSYLEVIFTNLSEGRPVPRATRVEIFSIIHPVPPAQFSLLLAGRYSSSQPEWVVRDEFKSAGSPGFRKAAISLVFDDVVHREFRIQWENRKDRYTNPTLANPGLIKVWMTLSHWGP